MASDYVVEFLDAGAETIGDQETFTDLNLSALLRLLSQRVVHDAALKDCCGMNIQQVDDSD